MSFVHNVHFLCQILKWQQQNKDQKLYIAPTQVGLPRTKNLISGKRSSVISSH